MDRHWQRDGEFGRWTGPRDGLFTTGPCDAYLIRSFWAETATDIDRMLDRQSLFIDGRRQASKDISLRAYCMGGISDRDMVA